jgi:hypothetical protein
VVELVIDVGPQLQPLVDRARDLVATAADAVDNGATCTGWFNARSGCPAQQYEVSTLRRAVDTLQRGVSDGVTTQHEIDSIHSLAVTVCTYAKELVAEADITSYRILIEQICRDVGKFLGEALRTAGQAVGEAAAGVAEGLGPAGTLVVLLVIYLAVKHG